MSLNDERVLACLDDSTLGNAVCDYSAWIAQRLGTPLKLLHTIDHHPETAAKTDLSGNIGLGSREHLLEEMTVLEQQRNKLRLQQGKALLTAAKERIIQAGYAVPGSCLRHGALIESLLELENSIRVLVVGARGKVHEHRSDQIGAKLEAMIRSLHRPILVAYDAFKMPERVMIAYDGGTAADKAVTLVTDSPLCQGLTCHLVSVGKNPTIVSRLERAADQLRSVGIDPVNAVLQGKAEHELCEYSQHHDIDITIMGAFSHTRLHDMLLGSFTHKMLLHTQKPLLLLH